MALKTYNPVTPGSRFKTAPSYEGVNKKKKPVKSLLSAGKRSGGRNNTGRITVRHIGGGNRRKYRAIDFKRDKDGIPARVASIEYDPFRTAYVALLHYADGERKYILAPLGLNAGDTVVSGAGADIKSGNALPISEIPVGTMLHAVELHPKKGAQMVRSAGVAAQLMAKENGYATLKLPSGEMRMVPEACRATVGQVGNTEHEIVSLGKAGRHRHMGTRPTVRGYVMNPVDHPHGGGEGKSPVGRSSPSTPWGKPARGKKTRRKKNPTDRFIVQRAK